MRLCWVLKQHDSYDSEYLGQKNPIDDLKANDDSSLMDSWGSLTGPKSFDLWIMVKPMWEFLQGFSDWNGENGISLEPKDGFNYISYIYMYPVVI